MPTLYLDTETYSECDLRTHSTHRYAEHSSTEIIVAQWAIDDDEPVVEDLTQSSTLHKPSLFLGYHLRDPNVEVIAHNSHFDRTLIRHCWDIDVPVERWRDTMVKAMAHGLPGALDKVGMALGVEEDKAKDKRGRELIQLFCKPRPKNQKVRRCTRETHPKEWKEFLGYSRQDIIAMREIDRRLPEWNYRSSSGELALWHLDQRINDRGFAVDLDLARAAIDAVATEQARLKVAVVDATDGIVQNVSKRDQLLAYILAEHGVALPDMRADTLKRRLEDPELPDAVKLLISLRLESTKTSTAKYKALVNATSADGRLRNTLQFCGAQRTGRWAGRVFQPQNMPRPDMGNAEIDVGIDALKAGCVEVVTDQVMRLTSNAVRGCIVAPKGKKLCVADLSNIEGRGLAFLAGEHWKLRAFKAYDTYKLDEFGRRISDGKKGWQRMAPDMYVQAYAHAFGIPLEAVDKYMRQQGKVVELGCLAGNTPVVTNNGAKAIMEVSNEDLIWDGEGWVKHGGVVAQGVKPVVNVAGIELTPDHLVLTGQTWMPAQQHATSESILSRALATASANLPSWVSNERYGGLVTTTWCASSAHAALRRIWSLITTCARVRARVATPALKSNQPTGVKIISATPISCQILNIDSACLTASLLASVDAITLTTPVIQTMAVEASTFTNHGARTVARFSRTLSNWKAGIVRAWSWTVQTYTKAMNREICDSSAARKTKVTSAPCDNCSSVSPNSRPTYDILNAGPRSRFTVLTERGPLIVHNCGYEGGVGSFITFAAVYDMDLDILTDAVHANAPREWLDQAAVMWDWFKKKRLSTLGLPQRVWLACEALVLMWRDAHPATKALWGAAADAVRQAIGRPGEVFSVGQHIKVRRDGAWLRCRLPSGRYLCYTQPQVADDGQISYMGINQYTRQWGRIKTYGGKLVENWTQAFARDVMAHHMPAIDAAGYRIVLSVHDELLTETPDTDDYSSDALSAMMATNPPWAQGLPLAAAGFESYRYRKDG